MAKTIKFNLICNERPIRTIEDLQENFAIEDVLEYYDNRLLHRWLEVRGYEEELAQVSAMTETQPIEIAKALISIFKVECDKNKIEESVVALKYRNEKEELLDIYQKTNFKVKQIIDDYHVGYAMLIAHMEENKDNMAVLKADADQLEKEYLELFKLDYFLLYYRLRTNAPKAIFAILTREPFRKFWIGEEATQRIYDDLKSLIKVAASDKEILGDDLKVVRRDTQAMWDPIEKAGVKLMVIQIAPHTFVKNAGEFSEKLSSMDVNDRLLILNGLEYQCNDEACELLYMEV